MNALLGLWRSTIGKKIAMAVSGILLTIFGYFAMVLAQ